MFAPLRGLPPCVGTCSHACTWPFRERAARPWPSGGPAWKDGAWRGSARGNPGASYGLAWGWPRCCARVTCRRASPHFAAIMRIVAHNPLLGCLRSHTCRLLLAGHRLLLLCGVTSLSLADVDLSEGPHGSSAFLARTRIGDVPLFRGRTSGSSRQPAFPVGVNATANLHSSV